MNDQRMTRDEYVLFKQMNSTTLNNINNINNNTDITPINNNNFISIEEMRKRVNNFSVEEYIKSIEAFEKDE